MQPPPPGRQTKAERKGLGELGVGLAGQRGVEAEVYALLGAKHKATDPGGEPGAPDVDAAAWGQELPPRNRRKEGVKLNSGGPGQGRGGAHRGAPATAPVPAPSLHGAPSRPGTLGPQKTCWVGSAPAEACGAGMLAAHCPSWSRSGLSQPKRLGAGGVKWRGTHWRLPPVQATGRGPPSEAEPQR